MDLQTTRINAAMLPSYHGRNVCVLGRAKNVDSNGTAFTLTTSDGKDVKVLMEEPLGEYVNGLTEVHGSVDNGNNLLCRHYVLFPQEVGESFNMELYNTAIELTARAPDMYQQGIRQS